MEKLLNTTKKIIFHRQQDILSSTLILSGMFIISRFFGILRYRIFFSFFTKEEFGLFSIAFRIPDFVFEILITGALSAAFIPLFIKNKNNEEKLADTVSTISNFIIFCLISLIIVLYILLGPIIRFMTPTLPVKELNLVISMSKILLISQLPFLVLGSLLSGIAQANKIFILTAIAPALYSLGVITGTILFSSSLGLFGPVFGEVIGATLFLLIQLPIIIVLKVKYQPFKFDVKVLIEFINLFIPRLLTVITTQIDLTIDLFLAVITLGVGAFAIFDIAQQFQFVPITFIGIAFAQAALPYLSDLYSEKKIDEYKRIFVNSILQLMYLIVPISLMLIIMRTPIIRLFYGGHKFDWEGTVQTARTLSFFCLAMPLHTIFYFITRAFYSAHDTKTPFKLNSLSVVINTSLSIFFLRILQMPIWSLALAFSAAITINVIFLLYFFYKKITEFDYKKLLYHVAKIYLAGFISVLISYPAMKLIDGLIIDTTRTINVFFLLITISAVFGMIYLLLSWIFNIEEIYLFAKLIRKMKQIKKIVIELYTDLGI